MLSADQLHRFQENGYLIVRQVLGDTQLAPIRRVMERAVDRQVRQWHAQGLIEDRCEGEPFETRYAALRTQLPATFSNSLAPRSGSGCPWFPSTNTRAVCR